MPPRKLRDKLVNGIPVELLLEESNRRGKIAGKIARLEKGLLPGMQHDVYSDTSRQISLLSVRSAGKTWSLLSRALAVAMRGGEVAFISKTYRSVEDIAWETMLRICRDNDIDIHPNAAKLRARIENRGRICFFGADNKKFRDNLRGSRWELIIVDEAGHFYSDLHTLVRQVLVPCTFGRSGTIIMCGTPYYIAKGLFYELTAPGVEPGGWSVHRCNDPFYNPYTKDDVKHAIALLKEEYGEAWSEMPHVRREFFAEWTYDSSRLVYKFSQKTNTFKRFAGKLGDVHILGLDFSFTGRTGLVECVANPSKYKAMFVIRARSLENIGLDQIDRLGPYLTEFHNRTGGDIVFDHAQKFIVDALREAFPDLNFIPAQKTEKYTHIELFNADFHASRVLVNIERCEPLVWEWTKGGWKRLPDGSKPSGRPMQNPRDKWDCSDACLYAWRHARVRSAELEKKDKTKPGTRAFFDKIAKRLRRQAREEVTQKGYHL